MKTTVVNVKTDEFDVYIGRGMSRAKDVRCRAGSLFANPYPIHENGIQLALRTFQELMRGRLADKEYGPVWREQLLVLRGKRLGCWCAPERCHGDVLVKLIEELTEVPA